jgi:Ca2+-binding RTX toxin-like protein
MKKQLVTVLAAAACSALVFAAVALATTIEGTQGNDSGANALNGTAGPDTIIAKKGNDEVNALAGDDYVNAGPGNDIVNGDEGNDRLSGKAGNDTVNGGDDNDQLKGKAGEDTLNGNDGDDVLTGGKSSDNLDGGPDDDTINGRHDGKAGDEIVCGDGTDTAILGPNDETDGNCENVEVKGKAKGPKAPKT